MAILVDFSQVIIASAMAQMGNSKRGSSDFSEEMIRHIFTGTTLGNITKSAIPSEA